MIFFIVNIIIKVIIYIYWTDASLYHRKYKSTTEAYNNMYIHRVKVIMYVYDVSASFRLNLPIFFEILTLFSFC